MGTSHGLPVAMPSPGPLLSLFVDKQVGPQAGSEAGVTGDKWVNVPGPDSSCLSLTRGSTAASPCPHPWAEQPQRALSCTQ